MLEEIRIRCASCHKKFSGQRQQIIKLLMCPRCGAASDWWRQIGSATQHPSDSQSVKNKIIQSPSGAQRTFVAANRAEAELQSATTEPRRVIPELNVPSKLAANKAGIVPSQPGKPRPNILTSQPQLGSPRKSRFWIATFSGIGLLCLFACLILASILTFGRGDKTVEVVSNHQAPELLDKRIEEYRRAALQGEWTKISALMTPWERALGSPQKNIRIATLEIGAISWHESGYAAKVHSMESSHPQNSTSEIVNTNGFTCWVFIERNWYLSQIEMSPLAALALPTTATDPQIAMLENTFKARPALYRKCLKASDSFALASERQLSLSRQATTSDDKQWHLETGRKYAEAGKRVTELLFQILKDDDRLADQLIALKSGKKINVRISEWDGELRSISTVNLDPAPPREITCLRCNGTGEIRKSQEEIDAEMDEVIRRAMNGPSGSYKGPPISSVKPCPHCGGTGKTQR